MTSNQIANEARKENERANRAKENENFRSNKAKESLELKKQGETARHNKKQEQIGAWQAGASILGSASKAASVIGNSPLWYNREPQLVRDVASIPMESPLGTTYSEDLKAASGTGSGTSSNNIRGKTSTPGVCAIGFMPAYQAQNDLNDAINIAAKSIYTYVRHANSGHANYESQDLMMYLLAVDSIFTWLYHLDRIYAVARQYSRTNRYYGECLLKAMHILPSSVIDNLADVRYKINVMKMKMSAFAVPAIMPIYNRHTWMVSFGWKDSPIDKAGIYVYYPTHGYKYIETDGAGYLQCKNVTANTFRDATSSDSTLYSVQNILTDVNEWITALVNSEDIGIMSGDILKAYGDSGLIDIPLTPEDTIMPIAYSEEVLGQIQSTVLGGRVAYASADVKQDTTTGAIYQGVSASRPYINIDDTMYGVGTSGQTMFRQLTMTKAPFVNLRKDQATPDDIMVSTRNIATFDYKNFGTADVPDWAFYYTSYGTEIFSHMEICMFQVNYSTGAVEDVYYTYTSMLLPKGRTSAQLGAGDATAYYPMVSAVASFDWAPRVLLGLVASSNGCIVYDNLEKENIYILEFNQLQRIHNVALLSLLAIGDVTKLSKLGK